MSFDAPNYSDATRTVRVAALYRFATVAAPEALRTRLEYLCGDDVRGTLLVAHEGVNGTIAGPPQAVCRVLAGLRNVAGFADLDVKFSTAAAMPFHRLKVRVKPEIVTLGLPDLNPAANAGTYVAPGDWNALIRDPDTIVIDTRNAYEGEIGAFAGAVQPTTGGSVTFPTGSAARAAPCWTGPRRRRSRCTAPAASAAKRPPPS